MGMKVELTIGDVIFLLDTFKALNNALKVICCEELEDLIIECEGILNEAASGDSDEQLAKFREAIHATEWVKA